MLSPKDLMTKVKNKNSSRTIPRTRTSKQVYPDFRLPRELWDINRDFITLPSKIARLYESKNKIESEFNKEKSREKDVLDEMKRLQSKYSKELQSFNSKLEMDKRIRESEFAARKEEIINRTTQEMNIAKDNLQNRKSEIMKEFEFNYQEDLRDVTHLLGIIDEIFMKYQLEIQNYNNTYVYPERGQSFGEIQNSIELIDNKINRILEEGDIISNTWDKVTGMSDEDTKKVGVAAVIAAIAATPIAVAGAGGAIALSWKASKDIQKKVLSLADELLGIKNLLISRKNEILSRPEPDLTYINQELGDFIAQIQRDQNRELEEIQREREEYLEYYNNEKNKDVQGLLKVKLNEEVNRVKEENKRLEEHNKKRIEELTKLHQEELERFKSKSQEPNMYDIYNQEIFQKTKTLNDILQKYTEMDNYNLLKYNHLEEQKVQNEKDGVFIDKYKEEYDRELYRNLYMPTKVKLYHLEQGNIVPGQFKHVIVNKEDVLRTETKEIDYTQVKIEVTKDKNEVVDVGVLKGYKEGEPMDREYFKSLHSQWSREEDRLYLLNTNNFHLGSLVLDEKYRSLNLEEQVTADNWNNGSLIMVYRNLEEEEMLINYTKYLIQQSINALHPNALQVNILNPTSDTAFNDVIIDTTHDNGKKQPKYVDTYEPQDLGELEKSIGRVVRERQYDDLRGGYKLSQVIKKKRKDGSKTPKWIINVMHRTDLGHPFLKLSENSETIGIINIVLVNYSDIVSEDKTGAEAKFELEKEAKSLLSKTSNLITVNKITDNFEVNLAVYDKEMVNYREIKYKVCPQEEIRKRTQHYQDRFHASLRENTTIMGDEFIMHVTEGKFWQESAHEYVKVHFGYEDGDRTKPTPVLFDEKSKVHGIIGGTTGGGKSVTLQLLANTMKAMYAPSELHVYYYDFKKVEVGLHAKPYKWPNAKALAGASTADYFVSLLDKLNAMMDKRYAMMEKAGVNKLSNYRELLAGRRVDRMKILYEELGIEYDMSGKDMQPHENMMKSYTKIKPAIDKLPDGEKKDRLLSIKEDLDRIVVPPRIVVIMDEIQEGFKIDDDTSEKLKTTLDSLSKVARAAGLHMILLTQDPGATIPDTILKLFVNKACTVATPDISTTIIGNDFCARPENQFIGFLGVNTSQDGNEDDNMQFVVPFAQEEHAKLYSKITEDLISNNYMLQEAVPVVVFDQNTEFTFDDLEEVLGNYDKQPQEIVLGEKIEFQEVFQPASITLERDAAQGIAYVSSNRDLKINFYKTFRESIEKDKHQAIVYFGKNIDEGYDVESYAHRCPYSQSVYRNNETGRIIYEYDADHDPTQVSTNYSLREWTVISEDDIEEIKNLPNFEEIPEERFKSIGYDISNETKTLFIEENIMLKVKEEIEDIGNQWRAKQTEVRISNMEPEEKKKTLEEMNNKTITIKVLYSPKIEEIGVEKISCFSARNYTKQKGMTELIYEHLSELTAFHSMKRKQGEIPATKYLIVIDPERDSDVFVNRAWRDKGFEAMVNEAMAEGIYLISISSEFTTIGERPWNRYMIGRQMSGDAQYNRQVKKLQEPFSICLDLVQSDKSFTLKMPVEAGAGGDDHLYGIE